MEFAIKETSSPAAVQTAPVPPFYIKPASQFGPRERQCCQCGTRTTTPSTAAASVQTSRSCECDHQFCNECLRRDGRRRTVIPHSFPVDWVCSTCGDTHSVLEILTATVVCHCEAPTLQAVYDQFGNIFLYWRDDPAVYDLSHPSKVQEAAWRVWEAGSAPWLPYVVAAEKAAKARELGSRGFNRLS
ncbi:hypothetical protein B0T26DRAFT_190330 [Lasiosphaeria miniovina]|uniref:RING-type domain-containing protein n=1 Tax=Lasiosphaeria miniovina TaxID=1954250 RepID=A0AA40ATK6_9PEZI|nr:uncharacterized protein B0T26DRAFT_190330 [Lasiosphaeria miniovina]KAK0721662.1 hypothetical protein B0T26DRAFT_190330 [Lasiosphaeria miniovina]